MKTLSLLRYENGNRGGALVWLCDDSWTMEQAKLILPGEVLVTRAQWAMAMSIVEGFPDANVIKQTNFLRTQGSMRLQDARALIDIHKDYYACKIYNTGESFKIVMTQEEFHIPAHVIELDTCPQLTLVMGLGGTSVSVVTLPDFTDPTHHMMDRLSAIFKTCQNHGDYNWLSQVRSSSSTCIRPTSMSVGDLIIFSSGGSFYRPKTFKVTMDGFKEQDTSFFCTGTGPLSGLGKFIFTMIGNGTGSYYEETLEGTCAEDAYIRAGKDQEWIDRINSFRAEAL